MEVEILPMMLIRNLLSEFFALRFTPWYRWHPQLAIRYLPVAEFIRRQPSTINHKPLTILEVGSGGLGIAPYLKQPVTGVDLLFDPPTHPLLTPVIGDATNLKFPDRSFDVVISMDMLEHLPKAKRAFAVSEMLRVARAALVIGVPCGRRSLEHDQLIQEDYKKRHGIDFPFAEEHIRLGLPEETDILGYIKTARRALRKTVTISVRGNTNLQLREFLMRGWMSNNLLVNLLFRKIFLLLIPLFRAIDRPPYYRRIFYISIKEKRLNG